MVKRSKKKKLNFPITYYCSTAVVAGDGHIVLLALVVLPTGKKLAGRLQAIREQCPKHPASYFLSIFWTPCSVITKRACTSPYNSSGPVRDRWLRIKLSPSTARSATLKPGTTSLSPNRLNSSRMKFSSMTHMNAFSGLHKKSEIHRDGHEFIAFPGDSGADTRKRPGFRRTALYYYEGCFRNDSAYVSQKDTR